MKEFPHIPSSVNGLFHFLFTQGYGRPNFQQPICPGKNDCLTYKSPLEVNLRQFNPSEKKMIAEIIFESNTPKKVNSAHLPLGKIYLEIKSPGKNHNQGTTQIFMSIPLPVRIKNGIAQCDRQAGIRCTCQAYFLFI